MLFWFDIIRYTLTELPEPPAAEPPSGGRKRKHYVATTTPTTSAKLCAAKEHIYGKLNPRELIQKLTSLGIHEAKLDERSPGSYMIHLVR